MPKTTQSRPYDINALDEKNLMRLFHDEHIVSNVLMYRSLHGKFLRKQDIKNCIGSSAYNFHKDLIYINPLTVHLEIKCDKEFLEELTKCNDEKARKKIYSYINRINPSFSTTGENYILRYEGDKYTKWYKVGETGRTVQVRASEWNYTPVFSRFVSDRKILEKLLHQHLNFAHTIRPAIHGKGRTEVEWFYISKKMLMRTMNAVINIFDPYSEHFNTFGITSRTHLTESHVKKQYRKLSKKYHPDKNPEDTEKATKEFQNLGKLKDELLDFISGKNIKKVGSNNPSYSTYSHPSNAPNNSQPPQTVSKDYSHCDPVVRILKGLQIHELMRIPQFGGKGIRAGTLFEGLKMPDVIRESDLTKIHQVGPVRKGIIIDHVKRHYKLD